MTATAKNIALAYIQAHNGVISNITTFTAWDGFRKRGIQCELFDQQQVYQRKLPLRPDTLVSGGVPVVEAALTTLGVSIPVADNLPECLAKYRGRKVWTSNWGELRSQFTKSGQHAPVFVKPYRRNKSFPAVALFEKADLLDEDTVDDGAEVLVAEYVVFASEWRCFVKQGAILDVRRYEGDVFRYPDPQVIKAAVADYSRVSLGAYAIDFGVLTDGRTVLVEANDGYSLGPYGLDSVEYAELLETRWLELMASKKG